MRRLVIWIAVLALVWGGWWWGASHMMQRGAAAALADMRATGWRAETTGIAKAGFPTRLQTVVGDVALADPANDVSFEADEIAFSTPVYWPGYATLRLPETPVTFAAGPLAVVLRAQDAQAQVRIKPGVALPLDSAALRSGIWQLDSPGGLLAEAEDLLLALSGEDAEARYRFDLRVTGLVPGDMLRAPLALPDDWPRVVETLVADIAVTLDRPLDRHALEGVSPQPRRIDVRRVEALWGPLQIAASGVLEIDAGGMPSGALRLEMARWRQMLDQAERAGVLPEAMRAQADIMLGALSNLGGGPEDLDLSLRFEDGQMLLGPIRLGPAPLLVLR